MLTEIEIEKHLIEAEETFARLDDSTGWLVIMNHELGQLHLTIEIHAYWLVFTINPLIERPAPENYASLAYHICRLNAEEVLTKFFIDSDTDVGLAIELPIENADKSTIAKSISLIRRQLDDNLLELQQISSDIGYHSRFLDVGD